MIKDKHYSWIDVEEYLLEKISKEDYFVGNDLARKSFSTMMAPPNVTGVLHMGHALEDTLQDCLVRYKRMQGYDALWQAGVDHAGIATQMVVERQLLEKGLKRRDLGREGFLQEVFKWKEYSQSNIENQIKKLGNSCDFSYMAFTMDENISKCVVRVFVELFNAGLIYKDNRLVNWDCKLQTAISDLEVENKEVQGFYYYVNYKIINSNEVITIATTRPETILADVAIAVNPEDERYKKLIGKKAIVPIINKEVIIIADEYADPEKGTGAVKITPAHDFNDFEVGKRHNLENINILNVDGTFNNNVPLEYQGLSVQEARKKIVQDLEDLKCLVKKEQALITIPYGDRSSAVIEPFLTKQWFVDAKVLAKDAIKVVEEGKIEFVPKSWENVYFDWMKKIEPWCISRQLWWGHQIPAYYSKDGKCFVANSKEEALKQAKEYYNEEVELIQDEDVLDTWFSSSLWSFAALGWLENSDRFKKYYPTDVLFTGFDIIFFWVARMIMMSLFFTKEVPFKKVYVHGLIRDEKGQKMSKSKGNVIDPLDMTKKYGTDALRFALVHYSGQGRDISLSEKIIEGYRNFVTKIWNSFKFANMNNFSFNKDYNPKSVKLNINKWILFKLQETQKNIDNGFEKYKFNEIATSIYDFIWKDYCDWYLELVKPILSNTDNLNDRKEVQETMGFVFDGILKLLHPIMPFITQYLYENFHNNNQVNLALEKIASYDFSLKEEDVIDSINIINLITKIRNIRADLNISYSNKLDLYLEAKEIPSYITDNQDIIKTIAKVSNIVNQEIKDEACFKDIVNNIIFSIPLVNITNINQEVIRIRKIKEKLMLDLNKIEDKLNNKNFIEKASQEVVEKFKMQKLELEQKQLKINQILKQLHI